MFSLYDYLIVLFALVITILVGFFPNFLKFIKKVRIKFKNYNAESNVSNQNSSMFNEINLFTEYSSRSVNVNNTKVSYDEELFSLKNEDVNKIDSTDRTKEDKTNFFLNLISLVIGFQTPISIIGLPIEFYFYGFKSLQISLSTVLAPIFISFFFVPFLYKLKSKSIYDYLNDKFDTHSTVKNFAIFLGVIFQFVFASMVLYSTSISITQIISLNYSLIQLWHVSLFFEFVKRYSSYVWPSVGHFCQLHSIHFNVLL